MAKPQNQWKSSVDPGIRACSRTDHAFYELRLGEYNGYSAVEIGSRFGLREIPFLFSEVQLRPIQNIFQNKTNEEICDYFVIFIHIPRKAEMQNTRV